MYSWRNSLFNIILCHKSDKLCYKSTSGHLLCALLSIEHTRIHTLWFPLSFSWFKSGCFDYGRKKATRKHDNRAIVVRLLSKQNDRKERNCSRNILILERYFDEYFCRRLFFSLHIDHFCVQSMHDGCSTCTIKNLQFSLSAIRFVIGKVQRAKWKRPNTHTHADTIEQQQIDGFSEIDNPESEISWASTILIQKTTTTHSRNNSMDDDGDIIMRMKRTERNFDLIGSYSMLH